MPVSGPEFHRQLMDAYTSTHQNLESAREQILNSREERDQLNDSRSDALVSLAEYYLPELTREAISQTWVEIRPAVADILLRKQERVARAREILAGLTAQREQQEQKFLDCNGQYDEALAEQKKVGEQVRQRLREDPRFVELSDRAAIAEAALERAEANLQEIDQDSVRKLPAYEGSSLFQYLHEQGFGTSKYSKRGFTRRVDRWLANMINYTQAKQSYEFLRRTPEQMRKIIAADRQALNTVMEELERMGDRVAVELGMTGISARVNNLKQQRTELLDQLNQLLQKSDESQQELSELEDSQGPFYREAVELFRQMLDQCGSDELRRRAEQTEDISDDQIVARLTGVEAEIGDLDASAHRRRAELDEMHAMLQALGRLVQRFRAAQFDSSRSHFVGSLDLAEEIAHAQDANDIQGLWQRIRRLQRWGPVAENDARSEPMEAVLVDAMAGAAESRRSQHARRAGARRTRRG